MNTNRPTLSSCCATTPSAVCFWTAMFLLAYGATLVLRWVWPALDRFANAFVLTALGVACVLNAARNRTYHCVVTAPLFLAAALAATLMDAGIWRIRSGVLWAVVLVGVAAGFLVEWRAARTARS